MKDLDNDIDLSIDEELDKDLEEIKNKINNISLDEDFKVKLKDRLDRECEAENVTRTKIRKVYFPKQLVAACACFIVLTSTVFADQIGGFIDNLFSNTFIEFEDGVAVEELRKIDMDYVEHDGVSIKIDYAMKKEDSLYLVFNVLAEEEFDGIYIEYFNDDFQINNQYSKVIFEKENTNVYFNTKYLSSKNQLIFMKISKINVINQYTEKTKIYLNEVTIRKDENVRKVLDEWSFDINI